MIRDAKFSTIKFLRFFYETLVNEPVVFILESVVNYAVIYLNSYLGTDYYAKYS